MNRRQLKKRLQRQSNQMQVNSGPSATDMRNYMAAMVTTLAVKDLMLKYASRENALYDLKYFELIFNTSGILSKRFLKDYKTYKQQATKLTRKAV